MVVTRKQMAVRQETDGRHEEKDGHQKQVSADKILAEAVTIDGRKSCLHRKTNVWARWRCRRCFWRGSGSSSSSGEETKKYPDPETDIRELREELKRYKNAEKNTSPQVKKAGLKKMEVGEDVDIKKKSDERKKKL